MQICTSECYVHIFRTYYADLFHMLAWRGEDAKGMCGSYRFPFVKNRKRRHHAKRKMHKYKCGGNVADPWQDFCSHCTRILCAKAGPACHPTHEVRQGRSQTQALTPKRREQLCCFQSVVRDAFIQLIKKTLKILADSNHVFLCNPLQICI